MSVETSAENRTREETTLSQERESPRRVVFWHRDLPPLSAEVLQEHQLEAVSCRVAGTISHRDELWDHCYQDLMRVATSRLEQEVARVGGHYAHVLDEAIDSRHDDRTGDTWLHGRFTYMAYREPGA